MTLYKKKSQISIFIVMAVVIIFSLILVLNLNFEKKGSDLTDIKQNIQVNTNQKLFPLKNNVDECLDLQLKKALIISGIKGGFIYDNGEYVFSANSPKSYPFLDNLNLNKNYLEDKILIHFQSDIFTPGINFRTQVYNHSIKEDFETFILDQFLTCINLKEYETSGFNLTKNQITSGVDTIIDTKTILVKQIFGKINDSVKLIYEGKQFIGNISSFDFENDKTIVKFNEDIFLGSMVLSSELKVTNLNSTTNIQVFFNQESVSAILNLPLSISNGKFSTSYSIAHSKINVRFKKLLELSKHILRAKSLNRSLDLADPNQISQIISQSSYFSQTPLNHIQVFQTKINDSDEFKRFLYTIVDNDSKILGSPYIFNFGYENEAPKIDLSKFGASFYSENKVMFITAKNYQFLLNIANLVSDPQYLDNFNFNFLEQDIISSSQKFSVDKFGNLSFIGFSETTYNNFIEVSDGETTRRQDFIFITGFPDNTNNRGAESCFKLKQNMVSEEFPIFNSYQSLSSFTQGSKNKVFGYTIFNSNPNLNLDYNPTITFDNSCQGIGGLFDKKAYSRIIGQTAKTSLNINPNTNQILIPKLNVPIVISVEITQPNSNNLIVDPFEVEIYPTSCLGPDRFNSSLETELGGTGTCCDLSLAPMVRSSSQTTLIDNLLKNNQKILDAPAYFFLNLDGHYANTLNFGLNNVWNLFGADATSIYEGNIVAKCSGIFPKLANNVDSVISTSPTFTDSVNSFFTGGNEIVLASSNQIPINVKKVSNGGLCEFPILDSYLDLEVKTISGKIFSIGLKALNTNLVGYINPLPTLPQFDNTQILCDSTSWFASTDLNPQTPASWIKNLPLGSGGGVLPIRTSRGYCEQGSNVCSGRKNPITGDFKNDLVGVCKDFLFDGNSIISKVSTNESWICGGGNRNCSTATSYQCP